MDRFLSIEAFVRVAETRSFAEAARQLGVTNSVVTHRVQQLERFIEAPLFHRSTRHVRLSEVGETYYKQCAEAVCMLTDLTDQMRGLRATPMGKLRIRMLPGYALGHFAEPLARFGAQYPDIQLDVVVDDSVVDPIAEGFDVAFQIFPPINDSLIEKRLFVLRRVFCASTACRNSQPICCSMPWPCTRAIRHASAGRSRKTARCARNSSCRSNCGRTPCICCATMRSPAPALRACPHSL